MKKKILYVCALVFGMFSSNVSAAPILFNVSIDTSSLANQEKRLIYRAVLNGDVKQNATITISNFSGATIVDPIVLPAAGVSGSLGDGNELIYDGEDLAPGDTFQNVILGDLLEFDMLFDGDSVGAPSNTTGQLALGLGFFDLNGANPVLTANPAVNFNFALSLDPSGAVNPLFVAGVTTLNQVEVPDGTVPVPGILALMLIGLFGMKRYLPKPRSQEALAIAA